MIPVYLLIYSDGSADIVPQANHSLHMDVHGKVSVRRGREFAAHPASVTTFESAAKAVMELSKSPKERFGATTTVTLKASPRHGTSAEASDNPSGAAPAAPAAPEGTARD